MIVWSGTVQRWACDRVVWGLFKGGHVIVWSGDCSKVGMCVIWGQFKGGHVMM